MAKRTILTVVVAAAIFLLGMWAGQSGVMRSTLSGGGNNASSTESSFPLTVVAIHDASNPLYTVSAEYPQFPETSDDFNGAIKAFVDTHLATFRSNAEENWTARQATRPSGTPPATPSQDFYFNVSWEQAQLNPRYISIIVRKDSYEGGANESQDIATFNYDVAKHASIALADLFPRTPDYLTTLSEASREQLAGTLEMMMPGHVPTDMINEGTAPTLDNFKNFTFTDDVITVYFPKYQVAPGVAGEQRVMIGRAGL